MHNLRHEFYLIYYTLLESSNWTSNMYFWKFPPKLMPKNFDLPKYRFLTKISIFDQNFDFRQKFRLWTKISIFHKNFNFSQKFQFFTKISIFNKNFDFPQKFPFSTKISIFDKNFDFQQKFGFLKKNWFWTEFSALTNSWSKFL